MKVFVSCPKGLQYVLEGELRDLGVEELKPVLAGVEVVATLEQVYKILLWSRIANRVFVELAAGKLNSADDLYDIAFQIDWSSHFDLESSFSVSFSGQNQAINNTAFGSVKVKDAIVDHFREKTGERPSVNKQNPSIRVSAKLHRDRVTISLDLSGHSLHKRGYRLDKGAAPLRENLAAGLLYLSGWKYGKALSERSFVDPMCGSGTLCIEAALIATNSAPGLGRTEWGFDAWLHHNGSIWHGLVDEASELRAQGVESFRGRVLGYDQDSRVVAVAWENIARAGLKELIHVEKRPLSEFELPATVEAGLLLSNPPYGERLGEVAKLEILYRDLGALFENQLLGWQAGVFTGNEALENHLGWKYKKRYKLLNGALESALLVFELAQEKRFKNIWYAPEELVENPERWSIANPERADMLRNRLRKNKKALAKWLRKNEISCYRLYDADMPEYAFALDIYVSEDGEQRAYVQEYAAPKSIEEKAAAERLSEALVVVSEVLELAREEVYLKQRARQKGADQYTKERDVGHKLIVNEGPARVVVNLGKYLDTGLFLDHRAIRRWILEHSNAKKVLNLFSYTCVVSLQAALGGASSVRSVDMSQTYLRWGEENFELNGLTGMSYAFERADCTQWLRDRVNSQGVAHERYDLIFIDPPSFSNSKRMEGVFDVQRDHMDIISNAMQLLSEDGLLIFSTNLRKFTLSSELESKFKVEDKTKATLDKDFERNQKIHKCWFVRP